MTMDDELRKRSEQDQFEAATQEALGVLVGIADSLHVRIRAGSNPSWWPKEIRTCAHLAHPAPCFAFWFSPGLIFCADCFAIMSQAADLLLEDRCDRCGKLTDLFAETVVQSGPLLISGDLCLSCRDEIVKEAKP